MLAGMLLLAASIATVETMYWHQMRHLAYLALIEAARAGATSHGEPGAIARAFARAMRARHAAGQPGQAATRQQHAWNRQQARTGLPAWRIAILQPGPTAFANHGVANRGLRRPPRIRNDYQAEQHAQRLAQGWPGGAGPRSGLTFSRPTRCGCGWSTAWRRFHPGWAPCSGRPLRWPRLARGPPGGRACCRYGSNWKWTCNPIRRSGRPGPMSPMATRGTATASPLRRQDSLAAILQ